MIHLIECDVLYDDLLEDYVSYGAMFERFFRKIDSTLTFDYFNAIEQTLPTPKTGHTYLITGSKSGAYETHEWIANLQDWIRQAFDAKARLIGVCFGHQIIAQALGGNVGVSEKGWGVGIRTLPVKSQPSNILKLPKFLSLIYSHQDQVDKLPNDAQTLLTDEFCPYAGFYIHQQVITFQGHPEFDATYTQRLLGRRADNIGHERFKQAMASLSKPNHNSIVGQFLLDWINLSTEGESQ